MSIDAIGNDTPDRGSWTTSSFCNNGACVEVQFAGDVIRVRDSKAPAGSTLAFNRDEWRAFVAGIRNSEFDF